MFTCGHLNDTACVCIYILYIDSIYHIRLKPLFLLLARNHDDGPSVKSARKDWMKGDCLSIAKKLALLKEFEEVQEQRRAEPKQGDLPDKLRKIEKQLPIT